MYLRVVIILNGVFQKEPPLKLSQAISFLTTNGFYISTRMTLGLPNLSGCTNALIGLA